MTKTFTRDKMLTTMLGYEHDTQILKMFLEDALEMKKKFNKKY